MMHLCHDSQSAGGAGGIGKGVLCKMVFRNERFADDARGICDKSPAVSCREIAGSCMPPDLMANMEKHITNVAARQVGGIDRTTRKEALHCLAAAISYQNMYITHCAESMDAATRARNSAVAERVKRGLAVNLGTEATEVKRVEIPPLPEGGRCADRVAGNGTVSARIPK